MLAFKGGRGGNAILEAALGAVPERPRGLSLGKGLLVMFLAGDDWRGGNREKERALDVADDPELSRLCDPSESLIVGG